jgi:uncharacterized membrane protein
MDIAMDKMLVAIFADQNKASEACSALKEMHTQGGITIYSIAIVAQNRQGRTALKPIPGEATLGSVLTVATSGLISLLGAPLRLAAKATAGTLADVLVDYRNTGVSADFLDLVSKHMAPGKTAVVAEVDEDWALPVDARMEALGGIVLRRARTAIEEVQFERDIIMLRADIASLKAASAYASRDTRAQIEARIDVAQSELQALQVRAVVRGDELKREADAKIKSVMGQAEQAEGETRVRLEQRIADLQADYEARSAKLNKVEKLAEKALAS